MFHFYDSLCLTGTDFLSMGGSYSVKQDQVTHGVLLTKMSLAASTVIGANRSLWAGRTSWVSVPSLLSCAGNMGCYKLRNGHAIFRQHYIAFFPVLQLLHSFHPFPSRSLTLEGVNSDVSLNAENSTTLILSTHLWVSVLTVANFKNKLDWPKLRATIFYGGKHNYWEGNMASCAFSSARIPPKAPELPSQGLLNRFTVSVLNFLLWRRHQGQSESDCLSP